MKIQCPSCRDIVELQEFTTSEAGLRLRCPACREVSFLANARNLPGEGTQGTQGTDGTPGAAEKAKTGGVTCPKCGHTQADPVACHRCGLMFSKFDPQALPPDPPEAVAWWQKIVASPGDEGLHEQFLAACDQAGRLDYATRQHRLLAQQGGPAELIARMQQRALQLAQAKLLPGGLTPSDRDEAKGRTRWVVYVVLLAALGLLSYLIFTAGDFLKMMR